MRNTPGRFRRVGPGAGLGNHGALYWSLDSEMEWLIESIFHRRGQKILSHPLENMSCGWIYKEVHTPWTNPSCICYLSALPLVLFTVCFSGWFMSGPFGSPDLGWWRFVTAFLFFLGSSGSLRLRCTSTCHQNIVKDSVNVLKRSNTRQFTEWLLALPEEYEINNV